MAKMTFDGQRAKPKEGFCLISVHIFYICAPMCDSCDIKFFKGFNHQPTLQVFRLVTQGPVQPTPREWASRMVRVSSIFGLKFRPQN